jgi:hypothetical protein
MTQDAALAQEAAAVVTKRTDSADLARATALFRLENGNVNRKVKGLVLRQRAIYLIDGGLRLSWQQECRSLPCQARRPGAAKRPLHKICQ